MADLLITTGHNASAVAISVDPDNGTATVVNAYELERLTGAKGDSRFPMDAMIALRERGVDRFDRVYVTHWDPTNTVDGLNPKYWDRSAFPPQIQVISQENLRLTHHDCHAHAAIVFAGPDFPVRDSAVLVVDGFGSFAEHLSYYRLKPDGRPDLVRRYFGYGTSLGLMYQYATAFLGMKMHEDEYKLLGYGALVADTGLNRSALNEVATRLATSHLKQMRRSNMAKLGISLDELPRVQQEWAERFDFVMSELGMLGVDRTSRDARIVVGYVVQQILQIVVANLISHDLGPTTNLIVTGGVAYNVELNRMLLEMTRGRVCFMPLAGDQGNAIGLWAAHNRRARLDLGDLCWGRRSFDGAHSTLPDGMVVVERDDDATFALLDAAIDEVGFVNLVRGRMEFGPRALCNTTTLAVANRPDVVAEINRINGRDNVMPFAPVVLDELVNRTFVGVERLWKSERYMITALRYSADYGDRFPGAALLTAGGLRTGRPQSYSSRYDGDSVFRLLRKHGLLINTSFNVHGVPICLDLKDVVHSHQYQRERNPNVRTIVISG